MKQEHGLTTTSIIMYVIAMVVVIGIIASITSFFYTNVNSVDENSEHIGELTKFHMYFLEETMQEGNNIYEIKETRDTFSISFTTGNAFTFQNHSIYFNHIKICENISEAQFGAEEKNGKIIVKVFMKIGDANEYTKTTRYVLNSNV